MPDSLSYLDAEVQRRLDEEYGPLEEDLPPPVVLEPLEGSPPYRGVYREPGRPEGFWRGAWRRLTGLWS